MTEKKRILEFSEGLTILAKYDDSGFGVQAEHDELFVAVKTEPSPEDQEALKAMGWRIDGGDPTCWRKFS